MNNALRHTRTSLLLAIATCATPALAQNAAPAAPPALGATAATSYGTPAPAARAKPGAANRDREAQLLGAPRNYGSPGAQKANAANDPQAALLDEQRMTVLGGGQPAVRKGQRNPPQGAANGKLRVAGQPGRPNAADGLMPDGAAKNTYADPYAGKQAVYKSPW